MAFDLVTQNYSQAAEDGYTFNLILPDGIESDATLTILGDLSPTVKNYGTKKYKELKAQVDAAKRMKREWEPTLEEAEEMAVDAALVRLIGWSGLEENKKKVEFSKVKAKEILKQHPWIREQIMEQAANVVNFTPKTSKD